MNSNRPLVFLDVDGPVNAIDANGARLERLTKNYVRAVDSVPVEYIDRDTYRRIHGEANRHRRLYGSSPSEVAWALYVDPDLPARLARLSEVADIVWATTWEGHANTYIAPLAGLPTDTPHVAFTCESVGHTAAWKFADILAYANGRRFVWFDDLVPKTIRRDVEGRSGGLGRAIEVPSGRGLSDADVDLAIRHLTA